MKSSYYYVYYSYEEWGRGYIGKRACVCPPEQDIKYFGSFSDKTFKPTQKIILQTFQTEAEAIGAEINLHAFYKVDTNPHFANKARQTSTGFTWKGRTHSKETKEKLGRKNKGRKRTRMEIEHQREARKDLKWWTNGKSQTMAKKCPGDGWWRGMLEGTTKGGKWWNNGEEQIFIKPPRKPPAGWERKKISKNPTGEPKIRLFNEPFRNLNLPLCFISEAKIIKKEQNLARLADGVVWLFRNYSKEDVEGLLSPSRLKRISVNLPRDTYQELSLIITLIKIKNAK